MEQLGAMKKPRFSTRGLSIGTSWQYRFRYRCEILAKTDVVYEDTINPIYNARDCSSEDRVKSSIKQRWLRHFSVTFFDSLVNRWNVASKCSFTRCSEASNTFPLKDYGREYSPIVCLIFPGRISKLRGEESAHVAAATTAIAPSFNQEKDSHGILFTRWI